MGLSPQGKYVIGGVIILVLFLLIGSRDSKIESPKQLSEIEIIANEVKEKQFELKDAAKMNRKVLSQVSNWILRSDWEVPPSIMNYGLPPHVFDFINKNVGPFPIESDIICYLISKLSAPEIHYMEIGVSVGKTLYQIIRFLEFNSRNIALAFDLESINPTFDKLVAERSKTEAKVILDWPFYNRPERKASIRQYDLNSGNKFYYFNSDEYDPSGWQRLRNLVEEKNMKFNVIFSDAFHTEDALDYEWNNIRDNNLLNINEFIYFYDDLSHPSDKGGMNAAYYRTCEELKNMNRLVNCKIVLVNGWLGNNEHAHFFGIISTLDLSSLTLDDYQNLVVVD